MIYASGSYPQRRGPSFPEGRFCQRGAGPTSPRVASRETSTSSMSRGAGKESSSSPLSEKQVASPVLVQRECHPQKEGPQKRKVLEDFPPIVVDEAEGGGVQGSLPLQLESEAKVRPTVMGTEPLRGGHCCPACEAKCNVSSDYRGFRDFRDEQRNKLRNKREDS